MMNINRIKETAEKDSVSTALVFKEHLQLLILEYLFRNGLFPRLVFQGGTALRLAYQGVRYSEDLDFVLGEKNAGIFREMGGQLYPLAAHLKKQLAAIADVSLKAQKETDTFRRYCLTVKTDFLDAASKVNIEIANVLSYEHRTAIIRHTDLMLAPAVTVESAQEIMADKMVAFGARDYIKGRDIWDIYFVGNTLNIPLGRNVLQMAKDKVKDYGLNEETFLMAFKQRIGTLKKDGLHVLHEEMSRFLPVSYRDAYEAQYPEICGFVIKMFGRALEGWKK